MIKKITYLISLILSTIFIYFLNKQLTNINLNNILYSIIAFLLIYILIKLIIEPITLIKLNDQKSKYKTRKIFSILFILLFLLILLKIWINSVQTLVISYGLIGAGLAIALQDYVKNFFAGIQIFFSNIYKIGDRIEVNNKIGDVIDINLTSTTLLELKEWINGEQPTGRITIIPNNYFVSNVINNYTKDNNFIWDEIIFPLTYDSDYKTINSEIIEEIKKETLNIIKNSQNEINKLGERYYLNQINSQPQIYINLNDNWIELNIRYITDVKQRRDIKNKINILILDKIKKNKIKIGSNSLDINLKK